MGAPAFLDRLTRVSITQSMTRLGRMNDNSHMESSFRSLTGDLNGTARDVARRRHASGNIHIASYRSVRMIDPKLRRGVCRVRDCATPECNLTLPSRTRPSQVFGPADDARKPNSLNL